MIQETIFAAVIVSFHNDVSPNGEKPKKRQSAHTL